MKKFNTIVLTAVLVLLLVCVGLLVRKEKPSFGLQWDVPFNRMSNLTSFSTSTGSYCDDKCPVKLLDLNANRRYAIIQNNSDTAIHLFATSTKLSLAGTGAARYATGSVTTLDGIRLAPLDADNLDDTYIISPNNMLYGYIYASSTASGKEILVNYYQ